MSYVPGYEHDIFVSYAHIDNEPVYGEGWVTALMKKILMRVRQKVGSRDVSLWRDVELLGNDPITPAILGHVQNSAILMVVMSPSYLNSEWCQREMITFFDRIQERAQSGRVFMVHMDKTKRNELPAELQDVTGYQFWKQDSENGPTTILGMLRSLEDEYYVGIDKLVWDLARKLMNFKPKEPENQEMKSDNQTTMLLAEPTDDLIEEHENLKRFLMQAELRVLPERRYPVEASRFQQQVEQDLKVSKVFVQLLGKLAGKKPDGETKSYVRLQYESALTAGKSILQWRQFSGSEDMTAIRDTDHRKLLQLPSVRTGSIDEFAREVLRQAAFKHPGPPPPPNKFVFINSDINDDEYGKQVCRLLDDRKIDYAVPRRLGGPDEMTQFFKERVLDCNGWIIVYGKVPSTWVDHQLLQWRKVSPGREEPPALFVVTEGEGPPQPKDPLSVKLAGMEIIKFSELEARLDAFVADRARRD